MANKTGRAQYAAVCVGVLVAVVVLSNRTKPSAALAITKVVSAAQESNTMVAIQIKLDNQVEARYGSSKSRLRLKRRTARNTVTTRPRQSMHRAMLKHSPPWVRRKLTGLKKT